MLRNNTLLAQQQRDHPEIRGEEIAQPVFIVGINRTGTTYLHRLLFRDERFWALRGYEIVKPTLGTDEHAELAGTPDDPRRAYFEDLTEATGIAEIFSGLHHIDVDEPEEEFGLLRQSFASWVGTVRQYLPEYARWLESNGSDQAYAHHRCALQLFNFQHRKQQGHQGQWLLKMPFHLIELEALVKAYPDALFIQTHREPAHFMASWNNLVKQIRSLSMEPRPPHVEGAEQLAFMSNMLDRAVDFREAHPELEGHWFDLNYLDLVEDPMAIVKIIYEHFNWPLEQTAVKRMDNWLLHQAQLREKEKRTRYDLSDYGLTPELVNEAFDRYRTFITERGIRSSRL